MNGPRVDTGAVFVNARLTLAGMTSIRRRERKDGTVTWVVQWRDAETGKQTSRSMPTELDAVELRDFLNANGNSFALAAQAASRLRSSSPTVDAVIAAHIDQLTAIGPDTRERYRRMAARRVTPVLGAVPVDTLTRRDVATWLDGMTSAAKRPSATSNRSSAPR